MERVRVLRIVIVAMLIGIMALLAVAWSTLSDSQRKAAALARKPTLSTLSAGLAGAAILGSILVPAMLTKVNRQRIAAARTGPTSTPPWVRAESPSGSDPLKSEVGMQVGAAEFSNRILSVALLEGAAMLGGVAYMNEGRTWVLGPVALVLLVMVGRIPTESGFRHLVETEMQAVSDIRRTAR